MPSDHRRARAARAAHPNVLTSVAAAMAATAAAAVAVSTVSSAGRWREGAAIFVGIFEMEDVEALWDITRRRDARRDSFMSVAS